MSRFRRARPFAIARAALEALVSGPIQRRQYAGDVLRKLYAAMPMRMGHKAALTSFAARRLPTVWRYLGGNRRPSDTNGSAGLALSTLSPEVSEEPRLKRPASDYEERVKAEIEIYNRVDNVHALPDIFHYWSNKHLRPRFEALGIRGINELFLDTMAAACRQTDQMCAFISIGAGHCDTEIEIARKLADAGHRNFRLDCLDINASMLARGRQVATERSVDPFMRFVESDIVSWTPVPGEYAVVMALESLHHFVELEALFDRIRRAIGPSGTFVTLDIIGRNGHLRWPEALERLEQLWAEMPQRYKYNHLLSRLEERYENWDCSTEGFEGIRAQDILPLLLERFSFEMFLGYGNLIDVFVDRAFGHNFRTDLDEDRAFIDRVAELDDGLIEHGALTPTHIVATMRTGPVASPRYYKHLTPEFCVRKLASRIELSGR
jgi:SAM-dependent methyltransferase